MDEFLKMLAAAMSDGKTNVEVHKVTKDDLEKIFKGEKNSSAEKEVAEVAHMNKILYEAHIKEGFTSEEALALTVATIQ